MDIGNLLKTLRIRSELTLVKAANKAGINSSHLSELERGNKMPRFDTVEQIAGAYGYAIKLSFISKDTQLTCGSK